MDILPRLEHTSYVRTKWGFEDLEEIRLWNDRVSRANRMFHRLQTRSVVYGLRRCTTMYIEPENTQAFLELQERGLIAVPIRHVVRFRGFSTAHRMPKPGDKSAYYCVVARNYQDAQSFIEAVNNNDDRIQGELLGYPPCCIQAFITNNANGHWDPVWQQAINCRPESIAVQEPHRITLSKDLPFELNSILKPIGLRYMPHTPCSHDCESTLTIAREWRQLAQDLKYSEVSLMDYFLSNRCKWTAKEGHALIQTTNFVLETNSIPCYPSYIVDRSN